MIPFLFFRSNDASVPHLAQPGKARSRPLAGWVRWVNSPPALELGPVSLGGRDRGMDQASAVYGQRGGPLEDWLDTGVKRGETHPRPESFKRAQTEVGPALSITRELRGVCVSKGAARVSGIIRRKPQRRVCVCVCSEQRGPRQRREARTGTSASPSRLLTERPALFTPVGDESKVGGDAKLKGHCDFQGGELFKPDTKAPLNKANVVETFLEPLFRTHSGGVPA